jgi:CHASE2 domain-containing sensor protein
VPRFHYARLIDAVSAAKPASLTFDVSLVDLSNEHPEWDAAIGEAAQRALMVFPDRPEREALLALAEFAISRDR